MNSENRGGKDEERHEMEKPLAQCMARIKTNS